jgi:hypothetical protein
MTQQFLDGAQIGAVGEKMSCIGVPQAMRVQPGIARNHSRVKLDDFSRAAVRQAPAAMIHHERTFTRLGSALSQILL